MENDLLATGERTSIRRFTRRDVDEWVCWPLHQDPLFQDYNPPRMSPAERDLWYSERLARPDHAMFAVLDSDQRLIGRLFLRQINQPAGSAVVGIDLRSDRLEQGLGTDALATFMHYYFTVMRFAVLKLDVAAYNVRAQKVYEKLGFVYVGEHWNTYPAALFTNLSSDPRYEAIKNAFRHGPGALSILHYDMQLTKARWAERQAHAS